MKKSTLGDETLRVACCDVHEQEGCPCEVGPDVGFPCFVLPQVAEVRSALPGRSWIAVCKVLFSFAGSLIVPPLAAKMILFMTFSRSVVVSATGLGLLGGTLRSRSHGFLFVFRQQLAALQTLKL